MKFIHLARTEARCRPEKPNSILHNDCGMQATCARRLAANTVGAEEKDFSRTSLRHYFGSAMMCLEFMSAEKAAERVRR